MHSKRRAVLVVWQLGAIDIRDVEIDAHGLFHAALPRSMLLVAALTFAFAPPPRCQISMMARRDPVVPRRDIGKAFAEAGGGEAMTGLIAIAGISFGAQYRQGVEDSSEALEARSEVRDADSKHTAVVTSFGGLVRLKQGERAVTMTAPASIGVVDLMWLRDGTNGKLIAAFENKKISSGAAVLDEPVLTTTLNVGAKVVPYLHCVGEENVVWKGATYTVSQAK